MNKKLLGAKEGVYILLILLFFVHQDFWFWDNGSLIMGFIPIGLMYHIGYSIVAAFAWFLAIKYAWPTHLESFSEQGDDPTSTTSEVR
jgi:hypothetical protein